MALFTGRLFVAQVSLIIVAKPFTPFFVPPVYLTTKSEDYRWQGRGELLRHFTGFYGVIQKYWRNKEK